MTARRLLPLALALALTAVTTLGSGVVAAVDLRADERRERAAAAERRAEQREREAVAAYQQSVLPLAVEVYDTVQPLQLAYADLENGGVDAIDVLLDVGRFVGGETGLPSLTTRLSALEPPASLRVEHDELLAGLRAMTDAARRTQELDEAEDGSVAAGVVAQGDLALDDATREWIRPVVPVFEGGQAPPVPVEAGTPGRRAPLSHAAYLRSAGNLCSAGIEVLAAGRGDPADPTVAEIRRGLRELAARVPQLLAVPVPPADTAVVGDSINGPLRRTAEIGKGFESALAAARRGDRAGVRDGQAQLARGEVAAQKAAAGYRAYGSAICALYLVGVEDGAGGGDAPEDTRAT